jgi:hypothetical protein
MTAHPTPEQWASIALVAAFTLCCIAMAADIACAGVYRD